MNNIVTHKGITFEFDLNASPIYLAGRGWAHNARLVGTYERGQLKDLLGLELWGSPVLGVESFCISDQSDRPIGLLLNEKKW